MKGDICAKFGVTDPFDPTDSFVTSPILSPLALAIVRLTLAFYTLFTLLFILIWDGVRLHDAGSFFSYFTELSYIGLCSYFWASGIQTLAYALRNGKNYPLQRWSHPLQFLHFLLFSTITTFPILVSIVYWVELASSETFATKFSTWENISIHAMNSAFSLFETLLTHTGPAPWTHVPFLIIILGCYLGVAYITHATQGFYTYSFLDPSKEHAKLAGWIIGIAVAAAVLHTIMRSICILREVIVSKVTTRRRLGNIEAASVRSQRTDEWETVERPGSRLV